MIPQLVHCKWKFFKPTRVSLICEFRNNIHIISVLSVSSFIKNLDYSKQFAMLP